MLNEDKIKTMTKLAIYEKRIGKEDFLINQYFKGDYILINNIWTRVSVTVSCGILFACYILMQIFLYLSDDYTFNIYSLAIICITIYIGLIIVYSIFSSDICRRKYKDSQRRLSSYNELLNSLKDTKNEKEVAPNDSKSDTD